MAGFASRRCWFVEKDEVACDRLAQGMTRRTRYVFVSSLQRERSLVMIEERRSPLVRIVAARTIVGSLEELTCVRVFMAISAAGWRIGKPHMNHRQFQIRWTVAF